MVKDSQHSTNFEFCKVGGILLQKSFDILHRKICFRLDSNPHDLRVTRLKLTFEMNVRIRYAFELGLRVCLGKERGYLNIYWFEDMKYCHHVQCAIQFFSRKPIRCNSTVNSNVRFPHFVFSSLDVTTFDYSTPGPHTSFVLHSSSMKGLNMHLHPAPEY